MKILSILVAFSVNMNFNATQWGLDNVKQFMQFYVVISQNHGASMHLFLRLLQRGKFLKMYDFCSSKDGIRLDIPVWYTNKITIIDFTIYRVFKLDMLHFKRLLGHQKSTLKS